MREPLALLLFALLALPAAGVAAGDDDKGKANGLSRDMDACPARTAQNLDVTYIKNLAK